MSWFDHHETLIQQMGVFTIAAAALQVALRAGVFSLLAAGTWLTGAYTAAIVVREGGGTATAMVAAVAIAAAVSLVMSLLTRRISGLTLSMATIAFDLIIVVLIRNGGDFTGGALGLYAIPISVSTAGVITIAVLVAAALALTERGRIGRAVVALREDSQAAESIGVPSERVRHAATTLSGALAALSGSIYALMFNAIAPEQGGFNLVVMLLSMVVVGGIESWRGAYIGAIVLLWLPDASRVVDRWSGAMYGALVVLTVVWAPGGLLGVMQRLWHAARRGLRRRAPVARSAGVTVKGAQ
jgi:branched-chain amino acid transport system permease protein